MRGAPIRKRFHRFIPTNFHDIGGLAMRLIRSREPAAQKAMLYSGLAMLLSPLDFILEPFEKNIYRKASPSNLPILFVCGAPRSGTTLVTQTLIKYLPLTYFNNLSSLFPRSPILAQRYFKWWKKNDNHLVSLRNFYGRTARISDPNDALYFWDRWTGADRKRIPTAFSQVQAQQMHAFFNAWLTEYKRPLINKNNGLNTYADLVAEILPGAHFICMNRDPLYLAQSHLMARRFIHGTEQIPYGIRGPKSADAQNPLDDICEQVLFHQKNNKKQTQRIGTERFTLLSYEAFCADPAAILHDIAKKHLDIQLDYPKLQKELKPIRNTNQQKIDDGTFAYLQRCLSPKKQEV